MLHLLYISTIISTTQESLHYNDPSRLPTSRLTADRKQHVVDKDNYTSQLLILLRIRVVSDFEILFYTTLFQSITVRIEVIYSENEKLFIIYFY